MRTYHELTILLAVAALIFTVSPGESLASGDIRGEAHAAVTSIGQLQEAKKFEDDMKSLELAFNVAERYFSNNEFERAEVFYLLALQKTHIIKKMVTPADQVDKQPEVIVNIPAANPGIPTVQAQPSAAEALLSANEPLQQIAKLIPSIEPSLPVSELATSVTEPPTAPADVLNDASETVLLDDPISEIVGARGFYTVVKSDTVRLVAAKLGVTTQHLRSMNNLDPKALLRIGQTLAYNNRKIIPHKVKNGVVINIPDRTLYYFQNGSLVTSLPVALGAVTKNEKYDWQTPVGKFRVTSKIKDPTWTVPPSIQTEMEEQGKDVLTVVPPGPENPLGKYAIKTSLPGILIHSTIKPASIYSFSSHGCIRLSPEQMESLFEQIKVNTRGEIIYKPVKLVVSEKGRVYLEVHPDVYKMNVDVASEAKQMVEAHNLAERINWKKFRSVVEQKNGVAEDISL